jgi:murein DD-endopeptidase MepM/ murein hydrolase activator NlpD
MAKYSYNNVGYNTIAERNAAMVASGATTQNAVNNAAARVTPVTNSTVNSPVGQPVGNLPGATNFTTRDLSKEEATIKKYGYSNPIDVLEATYNSNQLANMKEYQDLLAQKNATSQLKDKTNPNYIPAPSNSLLRPLEDGLRAISNVGKQELGTSELFTAAGLTGYATLAQSMSQRSEEMKQKYGSFANQMEVVGTKLSDEYAAQITQYNLLTKQYDDERNAIQKTLDRVAAQENALAQITAQGTQSRETAKAGALIDLLTKVNPDTGMNYTRDEATQIVNNAYGAPGSVEANIAGTNTGDLAETDSTISSDGTVMSQSDAVNSLLNAKVTQGFTAPISYIGGRTKHDAIDFVLPGQKNAFVLAPVSGVVSVRPDKHPGKNTGWGNQVILTDKNGNVHTLGHLSSFNVADGQEVKAGQALGKQGNTGYTIASSGGTGVHVHYEIMNKNGQRIDPSAFLTALKTASLPGVVGTVMNALNPAAKGIGIERTAPVTATNTVTPQKTLFSKEIMDNPTALSDIWGFTRGVTATQRDAIMRRADKAKVPYGDLLRKIDSGNWHGVVEDENILKYTDTLKRLIPNTDTKKAYNIGMIVESAINGDMDYVKQETEAALTDKLGVGAENIYVSNKDFLKNIIVLNKLMSETDETGVIGGRWQKALNAAGLSGSTDLAKINSQAENLLNDYVKTQSGVAFSVKEMERYASRFANISKVKDLNMALMQTLQAEKNRELGTTISTYTALSDLKDIIPESEWSMYGLDSESGKGMDQSDIDLYNSLQ